MFCRKCGAKNEDDAKFCNSCGESFTPESKPAQQSNPQQPNIQQSNIQQPYMQQPYIQHPPTVPGKSMATVSLICGIASIVLGCFPIGIGITAGIAGIILGILANKKFKMTGNPSKMATVGLILSIAGAAIALISLVACAICASLAADSLISDYYW